MTKGLARCGTDISFVLPKMFAGASYDWMNVYDASVQASANPHLRLVDEDACMELAVHQRCALTRGYFASSKSEQILCRSCFSSSRVNELSHVGLYAKGVAALAEQNSFGAIHAHDWMTYPAAMLAREVAGKKGKQMPFIAQIHATEIDRHDGQRIYNIEKRGLQAADKVIAVSNYTKSVIVENYGIDPDKIRVVHNGIEPKTVKRYPRHPLKRRYKLVLFIGRITYQKGPDYFVRLAKRVTDQYGDVKFLMVGAGDMQAPMVELAAREGLTGKLLFNSWLTDDMMDQAYQTADVFVMPSVSEPFGIVPLEAIQNGTPVIISKNAGVVEVVKNCVVVDFWDVEKMASAVVKLLRNEPYAKSMVAKAQEEVKSLTWDLAASKINAVYDEIYNETLEGVA